MMQYAGPEPFRASCGLSFSCSARLLRTERFRHATPSGGAFAHSAGQRGRDEVRLSQDVYQQCKRVQGLGGVRLLEQANRPFRQSPFLLGGPART